MSLIWACECLMQPPLPGPLEGEDIPSEDLFLSGLQVGHEPPTQTPDSTSLP